MTKIYRIILVAILYIIFSTPVYANIVGILDRPSPFEEKLFYPLAVFAVILNFTFLFILNNIIEYIPIRLLSRKYLLYPNDLLKITLFINFITFPITQGIALYIRFKTSRFDNTMLLAELFPFFAEYFLWKWQINILTKKGQFIRSLPNSYPLLFSLVANTFSFIIGLIGFGLISAYT